MRGRKMIGNWPLEVWERSHTIKTRGLGFVVKYCAYERDRSLVWILLEQLATIRRLSILQRHFEKKKKRLTLKVSMCVSCWPFLPTPPEKNIFPGMCLISTLNYFLQPHPHASTCPIKCWIFFSSAINTVQIQLPHKQYLLQNRVAPTYLFNETRPKWKSYNLI